MADNEAASGFHGTAHDSVTVSDTPTGSRRGLPLKIIGFGVLGLAIIGFIALMAFGLANKSSVTGQSGFTRIGKPVPTFVGQQFDGSQFDLAQHIGKPIVINFWATWCAPCRDEQPGLEAAWRAYEDDVLFVGVNIQDDETSGRQYIDEFEVTYPNVLDTDGRVTVDYGVIGIPVTFFINKQGIVERRYVGAIDESRLTAWVDDLVAGASPTGEIEAENPQGFRTLD